MMRYRKKAGRGTLPTAWASSDSRVSWLRVRPLLGVILATLLVPSPLLVPVHAQQVAIPATSPPPACATVDHRAFDFWIGIWDVTAVGQNQPTAMNRISRDHAGCVIREDYETTGGYSGMSMSFYDAARKKWHQTWMGLDGAALFIEGGLNDHGEMVLSNRNTPYYQEGTVINRVTWTPNTDGSVRQHWQASSDDGSSWSTVFDGLYVRQALTPAG
ncbi:hypothetical protein [Parasphingorhabdus sp.]|uniref:hypothetical protein n=1 Tax=Parasphingorhabdus sp. TaxID=2709688 RepID=UPI003C78D03C